MKIPKLVILGVFLALLVFSPALTLFYTNDDFFHFRLSQAGSVSQFVDFFNLTRPPLGFGWYRPLTTQVFYFLGLNFFSLQPLPLHLVQFSGLILLILLAYFLAAEISGSVRIGSLAAFLYAVSATHFAHTASFSVFQEVGLGLAYFSCIWTYIRFARIGKTWLLLVSWCLFLAGLACKEWAVTLPFVLLLFSFWLRVPKKILYLLPFFTTLGFYLFFRLRFYGFAGGDSYIWQFNFQSLNTLFWYLLWSFNIPEMFVDFIGPGIRINPNLLRFWGRETVIIAGLFCLQVIFLCLSAVKSLPRLRRPDFGLLILLLTWFVLGLSPVLFLPWHKFSFFLTVSLLPLMISVSYLLDTAGVPAKLMRLFLIVVIMLFIQTVSLTWRTNWITQGAATAARVNSFVRSDLPKWLPGTTLAFYDTPADSSLPWSPTSVLKNVLSDNNYFRVFTAGQVTAVYLPALPDKIPVSFVPVPARQFLGY